MTEREIADRIRATLTVHSDPELAKLAEELDPPRPEPGTVVWWQDDEGLGDPVLGQVNDLGFIELFGTNDKVSIYSVKWWPARIAGPMQEIVDIPPVEDWPEYGEVLITLFEGETKALRYQDVITRAEAERREAEG